MSQTLLKIQLPAGKTLYASRFRELLARDCNLPPAFFHYAEGGNPLPGAPLVRVVGGRSWVGILGDGEGGGALVEMAAGSAIRVVHTELGGTCPVNMEMHTPYISATESPNRYWVREMIVKRRSKQRREQDIEALAGDVIMQGLKRAARGFALDESMLENDILFRVEAVHRPRGLRISTTTGETNEFATLMDVEFTINRHLTGIWLVGNMTARGYGRIGRNLSALANGPNKARGAIR